MKKKAPRKHPAAPGPKLATLKAFRRALRRRPKPPVRDERLKSAAELMLDGYDQRAPLEYGIAHAEEMQKANEERALYKRAARELRLAEITEELKRKAHPEEPGVQARTKLTPAIIAAHLAAVPMGAKHSNGRSSSWQERVDHISKMPGVRSR